MVHIILPVHNRKKVTGRFIECLKKQTRRDYHLILVDDGSTDGTADMVQEHIRALTIITGSGDWWWGGALHEGYKWLRARNPPATDIVLIMNDDTEFEDNFLEAAVAFLLDHHKTLLLARCFSKKGNTLIDAGIHVDWKKFSFEQPTSGKPVNCLSTRGLFFRVEDFFSIGGFHPILLPHYFSDYEFTIRAQRRGLKLTTDDAVHLWLDASTTGYHRPAEGSFLRALRSVLTVRSAINPLPMIIFVGLACPWPWKLVCWFRIMALSVSHGWGLLTGKEAAR